MGKKRGQIHGEIIRVFIIAIVAVLILYFGFKSISKISEKGCQSELILFKQDLRESSGAISSRAGDVEEKSYSVPCKADKVYFADLDKNMSSFVKSLYELPLVGDFIKSNIEKNVVLVKDKKVIDSFYIGNIELQKPYFVCADTARGNLDIYLSGTGTSTEIVNKECAGDCTFELVDIDEGTAREVIEEAIDACDGCPQGTLEAEMERFRETNQSVRIARRCNCGRMPGQAVVEILIKPGGSVKHFKLIESIPKEYIPDLERYLENMSGDYDYYRVLWDPLIMWHFNEISEETIVKYTLNADVFEYCADVLKTVGLGVNVESEGVGGEEELDKIEKILELNLGDVDIPPGSDNYHAFTEPIWHYLKATDILPSEKRAYTYQISKDESDWGGSASYEDLVCEIREPDKHIICDTPASFSEQTFYVRVLDLNGDGIAQDTFDVIPFYCGGLNELRCKSDPTCDWCPECDNNRWSGYIGDRCVDSGDCLYSCNIEHCGAECDSTTNCYDGCYDGRHFYECGSMGCEADCTCLGLPDRPPQGCSSAPDQDGDDYQRGCDCLDAPSEYSYAANVYPGSSNPYCNCDDSDGYILDLAGVENECGDSYDNDCDGKLDCEDIDCGGVESCPVSLTKLKCKREERYTGCQWNCQQGDCEDEFGEGWQDTGSKRCGLLKKECKCKYDRWTDCSIEPECPSETDIEKEVSC